MTATLAWIDIAHGMVATNTVTPSIHSSISKLTLRLPNQLRQDEPGIDMEPSVHCMLFDYFDCSVCVFGGESIDVGVAVQSGDDFDRASNA
jgi:hypothetical protein